MLPEKDKIYTKSDLNDWLEYELKKYRSNSNAFNTLRFFFPISEADILIKHQIILRKTEYYFNSHKKLRYIFYKLRLLSIQNRYSLHIPINVCNKGLKIMHLGPVLINPNSVVGHDVSFHINTALVAGGTSDAAPVLGDKVVVGIGAVVLGGIHIASSVAIGANAVVNKNVLEENIAVAGVPAKKISENGTDNWNKNVKQQ